MPGHWTQLLVSGSVWVEISIVGFLITTLQKVLAKSGTPTFTIEGQHLTSLTNYVNIRQLCIQGGLQAQ